MNNLLNLNYLTGAYGNPNYLTGAGSSLNYLTGTGSALSCLAGAGSALSCLTGAGSGLNCLTRAADSLMSGYEMAKNLTHPGGFLNMLANANPAASAGASGAAYGNSGLTGTVHGTNPGSSNVSGTTQSSNVPGTTQGNNVSGTTQSIRGTQAADRNTISREAMTMEEYKQYLYGQISQIPLHPTRVLESISIDISDAGFEAMKNDPEYEAWVLDGLKTGWAQPNPWTAICGGGYSVLHYGAAKEEYHGSSWYPGYQNGKGESLFNSRSKNSFWERRTESQKLYQEQSQAAALELYYQQQRFSMLRNLR